MACRAPAAPPPTRTNVAALKPFWFICTRAMLSSFHADGTGKCRRNAPECDSKWRKWKKVSICESRTY